MRGVLTFPTFKQSLAGVCAFGRWAHFAAAYIHKYFCSIIGCQNKSVFPVCVCVSVSMTLNLFVHLEVEHKCFYSPPCGFLLPVWMYAGVSDEVSRCPCELWEQLAPLSLFQWFCVFNEKRGLFLSIFHGKPHVKLGINYIDEVWRNSQGGPVDNTIVPVGMKHRVQSMGIVAWLSCQTDLGSCPLASLLTQCVTLRGFLNITEPPFPIL